MEIKNRTDDAQQATTSAPSSVPVSSKELPPTKSPDESADESSYEVLTEEHLRSGRPGLALPIILFLITCVSTFWAGVTSWDPIRWPSEFYVFVHSDGLQGLTYMACVLAILMAHEMGHFIATIRHGVPASLPFFIPFPFTPIGTMGAVIAMDGRHANRRQIFDIGISGPLAGLIIAIPVLWYGIRQIEPTVAIENSKNLNTVVEKYDCPIIVEMMFAWMHPNAEQLDSIGRKDLNPFFMAGWVGLLITGLNMLPVSQLDGGHIIYTLFGRWGHWIARSFILVAITAIALGDQFFIWAPMTIIVILLGTDHPPTKDDSVALGKARVIVGAASLSIPILCFPAKGVILPIAH